MHNKRHKILQGFTFFIVLFSFFFNCTEGKAQPFSFEMLKGQKKVEIPFTYSQNFILLEVKMFALLPMKFIFDTGAEHTILFKRQYADIMGVQYERRIPIVGSDLSKELYALVARQVTLQVSGMPIMDKDILVLEKDLFKLDEITGSQIDGIIGGEFFKNVIIHIDYKKQKITLYPKKSFSSPGKGYKTIPLSIKSNKPYTIAEVTLQDARKMDLVLLIDTGAGIPLLLHNNSNQNLGLPDHYIAGKLGVGLGGLIKGYIGRVQTVKIGDIQFNQVITNFQDLPDNIILDETKFRNGIIGNQILSRFDVWFDYIEEKLYLKPGKKINKKFEMDKSGMIVFATGQNLNVYVVQDIIEGSPADKAGIQVGDVIKKIQGFPAKIFSLNGIIHKLQKKSGKQIRLQILRDNQVLSKRFKLKELV